jgi:hypothetical protein
MAVAALGGPAAEPAITSAWSFVWTQVLHAIQTLPTQAPFDEAEP